MITNLATIYGEVLDTYPFECWWLKFLGQRIETIFTEI